ncbi:GYD domain-containing protein [Streptomyces spinoverrucosus]|uniref:GYD domain-containing protein n=1 Tax=Streptomyces spinoverrucosus TaxID=284043 RepID=UPI0018C4457E|nr:GYD domain-containing protein [Streptomyces spinoverrucosus]MBG0855651.1 GYD domain-containing protein [Streptomyces spinoverrucosus]
MPMYLVKVRLTPNGLQGLLKEGATARREVADGMLRSLGGRLESIYWALGDDDVYLTAELPNNTAAAALGMVTSATGSVRTSTVALLTAEEVDEAARQKVDYRPAGA